jgi:HD-GYP domain-containing protein (c-di-GMP phosphodiesterase class II)
MGIRAFVVPQSRIREDGQRNRAAQREGNMSSKVLDQIAEVNKELWLLLSLFGIAALLNFAIASHRVLLGFYALPSVFSAYYYGRRHAVMTAVASVCIVGLLLFLNPATLREPVPQPLQQWLDLAIWAGTLMVTAYAMGTLYEHKSRHLAELRDTYNGVLTLLCHFISKDSYTQNHSYRTSIYASRIAERMGLSAAVIEDIRAAALLHDIGKLEISRPLLYKAAKLTDEEYREMAQHVERGGTLMDSVGGSLRRVIPLILAHHDRFDGTGQHKIIGEEIPLGARVIAVADVYDALTSDRPYRKAMSPFEARDHLVKASGTEFDPHIVEAFLDAFRLGMMEVSDVLV